MSDAARWSVYVVRTQRGTYYTGIATDVARRVREHREGGQRAARYLRSHPVSELVFQQQVGDRALALRVEYRFKRLPRARKEAVIRRGKLHFDPDRDTLRPAPEAPCGRIDQTTAQGVGDGPAKVARQGTA